MRLFGIFTLLGFFVWPCASAPAGPQYNLMPMPSRVQTGTGELGITQSFSVAIEGNRDPRLEHAATRFLRDVTLRTGLFARVQTAEGGKATLVLHAEHTSKPVQELGEDESYTLDISAAGATLAAPNSLGIMHGLQTFLQLIEITPTGFAAP